MSALGHKRTLPHVRLMSALPPKADIAKHSWAVRFAPKAYFRKVVNWSSLTSELPADLPTFCKIDTAATVPSAGEHFENKLLMVCGILLRLPEGVQACG
jgi:hypothetical protein